MKIVNFPGFLLVSMVLAGADGAAPAPAVDAELQAKGRTLFVSKVCSACHSIDGTRITGPTMKGLFGSNVTLNDQRVVVADEAYLRESIMRSTAKIVAGYAPVMPNFKGAISDAELDALVAYIRSVQ